MQDKLASLGTEIVERFIEDTIGVTRVTIAEADKFPALSRHVHEARAGPAPRLPCPMS